MSLAAHSDVVSMRFTLERIACATEPVTPFTQSVEKPLEDIQLPGGIPGFEDAPLDGASAHLFADMFLAAAPGCYRVTTQPLTALGTVSLDCAPAIAPRVQIKEGVTTEQILINQCKAEGSGGIDVVSVLNHPPSLVKLEFAKSKFVLQCQVQEVCATVKDPENDPLTIVWSKVSGPPLLSGPETTRERTEPDGSVTRCVAMVAETPGQYGVSVTAYDMLHDPASGGLMRIEDYLAQQGSPQPSHTQLTFPFYVADNGMDGGCTAARSCLELKQHDSSLPSGRYTVDPDQEGPIAPFEVYCEMEKDGGGWTLALVSSDDGQNTWTWDRRTLLTTDPTLVGNLDERNKDFKSRALHTVPFESLLFVHAPSGVWASYSGISNGTLDAASFMSSLSAPVCNFSLAGNGYPQTAGTLTVGGGMCDTDLYFNLGDFDGGNMEWYCQETTLYHNSTYGPGWSVDMGQGCPFDDPSHASLGPDTSPEVVTHERPAAGFGLARGLNTGAPGTGSNYIQMYVR